MRSRRISAIAIGAAFMLASPGCAGGSGQSADAGFTNPLLPSGPDPWVTQHDGVYYYTHTTGDRIELRRTRDMARLAAAERRVVWTPPKDGPNAHSIWAPELHRIAGKWYLYYSATAAGFKDDAHRAIFVLENSAADPLDGSWVDRGRVNTKRPGIDGSILVRQGQLYFAYSPYLSEGSGIAIARMTDPWTLAADDETVIARPDRSWEDRGGRKILEGPQFLQGPTGDLFMSYSAGACWSDDYALGLLRLAPGRSPTDAGAWTKSPAPVLKQGNGVFATGHNGFFKSPDGREDWIIYHANAAPGMGCTAKRAPYMQRIEWTRDGRPVFPTPAPAGARIVKPSASASKSVR